MRYYYGVVFFQTLMIVVFLRIGYMTILMRRKLISRKWLIFLGVLTPLVLFLIFNYTLPLYKDIPNALNKKTKIVEGTIDTVYFQGDTFGFLIEGIEYQRDPWALKPEEGEYYRLYYLPESKFVIDHEQLVAE
ncbi:hypothetical protein ACFP65_00075 [Marinilactibacillus sp. GCM10026970]|uniref:hypothetical protein n=1 Tax=Marinilactibacillus sp. GCM10026970 TaxID=3252642 RepID=UPI003622DB8D